MPDKKYSLDDALYLMQRLRDPQDGCPWDIKQQYTDIVPYTLEEAYELADAIASGDMQHTEEELGDVLFQVIFYAQLGSEDEAFDFASIVHKLVEKLVRRHPHVFPNGDLRRRFGAQTKETAEIKANWEALKQQERGAKQKLGILDDVPNSLPALSRAQKLQKRVANVGMDWASVEAVFDVLESEIAELRQALVIGNTQEIKAEAGDVLFSVVNLIRHLKFDAEDCMRGANHKFSTRIGAIEAICADKQIAIEQLDVPQLEALWQQAKLAEKP